MSRRNGFRGVFGFLAKGNRRRAHGLRRRPLSGFESLETRQLLSASPNDLAALSDEFDDSASAVDWQRVNEVEGWNADQLEVWNVDQTQPGRMVMQPHTVVWYQDWRGPMVFKEVSGDFIFTSEIVLSDRDDVGSGDADDVPDDATFSLGGIMIRTPRAINDPATDWRPGSRQDDGTNNGENYVFLSMGHGTDGQFSFEVKTTRNSRSQLELTPLGQNANTATLRIARAGSAVITMYRLPGEDWTVHRRYTRPDMPETMQLGLVTYTDWNKASDFDPFVHNSTVLQAGVNDPTPSEPFNPDLVAGFEYARFARPQVPTELAGVNLVNAATDEELLSFLGDVPVDDPQPDPEPEPDPSGNAMRVGVNLDDNIDWSSAWVFKDAFNRARPWGALARNPLTGQTMWQFQAGNGPSLQVNERGWVTELPGWTAEDGTEYQQLATTVIFAGGESRQPAGVYRAEWEGTGELSMPFVIEQGEMDGGRHYALVDMPYDAHFTMTILSTDPADPIRDIDLWMPDYEGQSLIERDWQPGFETSPFHPLFVERLQGFDTLRFMDWQRTNHSDVVTWQDRSRVDDASQADNDQVGYYEYLNNGVAPEYQIALANEVGANPWFNMPHMANDDFVRNFATTVRDTLDPELTVYVEWSNELWNSFFPVNGWIGEQTQLPENEGQGFFQIAAREIRRDFDIWSDVFAGQEDRLVRVVAGQQSNPSLVTQLLANMGGRFDAISSTAYAGLWEGFVSQADINTTADDIIDSLLEVSIPWSRDRMIEHRAIADGYEQQLGREIDYVTYESGSHVFGFNTSLMNSPALDAAVEAMYSPRMYDVYQTLLHEAQDAGVDLYNEFTFTSHYGPSPYGTYGLLHTMDQPLEEAHQLRSLLDFAGLQADDPPVEGTVTIAADREVVVEGSDVAANFVVTRSGGAVGEALTVSYSVAGSAAADSDYAVLSGSVTIPAGQTSANIIAALADDGLMEGFETIALTLDAAPGYNLTAPAQATITIADNDFLTIGDQVMGSNDNALSIVLPATDPSGATLQYSVALVDQVAYELDQQHSLYSNGEYYTNWGGQQEKWLRGSGGWYYLLPAGELWQWQGSFAASTRLAELTPRFYDSPALLHEAQPRGTARVEDATLIVEPADGTTGQLELRLTTSNGHASATELVTVSITNHAPTLSPIADQVVVAGSGPLTIELHGADADGDSLSYEARVAGSLGAEIMAEHHLHEMSWRDDYALNWGGQDEKWLQGDRGWYFLLPDGTLNLWGGSFESSTLLAQFSQAEYDNPHRLLQAVDPGVTAEIVNGRLVVTPGSQTGSFQIQVIVSDGVDSASRTFNLDITNTAPSLNIADQTAVAGNLLAIQLSSVDADGHEITYTVEVLGDQLSALDSQHGFWSDGKYYTNYHGQSERWIRDSANRWHYLLPSGDLHRWEGSFTASPLIAQLGSEVYDDPSRLIDPQPVPVVATISNGVLTITAAEGYTGEVQIRVTASDGYSTASTVFDLLVVAGVQSNELESVDSVFAEWELLEV